MPKYKTGSQFDEFFINAFQFQQTLNEKRNQRVQDINFRLRELTLLSDYQQDVEDRLLESQNIRKQEELGRYVRQEFTETPEGQTPDVTVFGQGLTSPVIEPKQEGIERTITDYSSGEGIIYGITDSGEKKRLGKAKPITEGKDKTTKEPKLTESASDGLAFLKNPVFQKGQGGNLFELTNDEISNKFSESINALKKDVLGARASNWFDNIVREFGRIPTADELDKQIIKHAEEFKTLTDTEVGQLNRLVEYLEGAESGIKRIQDRLKPVTEKEDNGLLGIGAFGL